MLSELYPDGISGMILLLAGSEKGQSTLAFDFEVTESSRFQIKTWNFSSQRSRELGSSQPYHTNPGLDFLYNLYLPSSSSGWCRFWGEVSNDLALKEQSISDELLHLWFRLVERHPPHSLLPCIVWSHPNFTCMEHYTNVHICQALMELPLVTRYENSKREEAW